MISTQTGAQTGMQAGAQTGTSQTTGHLVGPDDRPRSAITHELLPPHGSSQDQGTGHLA